MKGRGWSIALVCVWTLGLIVSVIGSIMSFVWGLYGYAAWNGLLSLVALAGLVYAVRTLDG